MPILPGGRALPPSKDEIAGWEAFPIIASTAGCISTNRHSRSNFVTSNNPCSPPGRVKRDKFRQIVMKRMHCDVSNTAIRGLETDFNLDGFSLLAKRRWLCLPKIISGRNGGAVQTRSGWL